MSEAGFALVVLGICHVAVVALVVVAAGRILPYAVPLLSAASRMNEKEAARVLPEARRAEAAAEPPVRARYDDGQIAEALSVMRAVRAEWFNITQMQDGPEKNDAAEKFRARMTAPEIVRAGAIEKWAKENGRAA